MKKSKTVHRRRVQRRAPVAGSAQFLAICPTHGTMLVTGLYSYARVRLGCQCEFVAVDSHFEYRPNNAVRGAAEPRTLDGLVGGKVGP